MSKATCRKSADRGRENVAAVTERARELHKVVAIPSAMSSPIALQSASTPELWNGSTVIEGRSLELLGITGKYLCPLRDWRAFSWRLIWLRCNVAEGGSSNMLR